MYRGYIKLWRRIEDSAFYKKANCIQMVVHLLLKANHAPKVFIWNGVQEIIDTGQVLTGRITLAEETGQSQQEVRTALQTLSHPSIAFLTIKSTNRFSIISICKYQEYQDTSTNTLTNKQPTNNQQTTSKQPQTSIISIKEEEKRERAFTPPTLEEVRAYCKERRSSVNPDKFFYHYEANGWIRGKTKIKKWKMCLHTWEVKNQEGGFFNNGGSPSRGISDAEKEAIENRKHEAQNAKP